MLSSEKGTNTDIEFSFSERFTSSNNLTLRRHVFIYDRYEKYAKNTRSSFVAPYPWEQD